jgi:response regulator RpfG family c-di-GMP phosphodiesterase
MSITHEIRPYRVLVVDDQDHARMAIKTVIGAAVPFCEFADASNTDEAQKFLMKEFPPFDLAVIDLKLEESDKDGLNVVRIIKGVLDRYSQTRVILYTAYPTVESACAAYEAGADSYISKIDPDATKKLQDKAKELLFQRDLRDRLLHQSQAHREAQKAFEENKEEWIKKYGGRFVIVREGKVIAEAKDLFEADQLLGKYTPNARCDLAVLDIPSQGRKDA